MNDSGNLTSIIIALISLLAALVAGALWTVRWLASNYGADIKEHTVAATKLARASDNLAKSNVRMASAVDKNSKSNDEVLAFMKNLNGKLAKATIQTIKEQHVEHQHIETEIKE